MEREAAVGETVVGRVRKFVVDEAVLVKNFGIGDKWLLGVVVSILGEVNYHVLLSDCRIWHRHVE